MRTPPERCKFASLTAALIAALALSACTVEAGDEAAHALAEKFATGSTSSEIAQSDDAPPASAPAPEVPGPRVAEVAKDKSEPKRRAAEKAEAERRAKAQREADEAEMLARARAEAEERRLEMEERLRKVEQAEAEAERIRAANAAEEEQRRRAEAERKEAEAKRLAEAAAQEEARREAEERRVADERRRAEEERRAADARRLAEIAAQDEARRTAEARRVAVERQLEAEERRKAEQMRTVALFPAAEAPDEAELDRAIEAQRLAHKMKQIRDTRQSRDYGFGPPYGIGARTGGDPDFEPIEPLFRTRVTVLLAMQPGSRGIRRFDKTADPILCVGARCYVSRGAGASAEPISRGKAFGPGVALGSRAGLCNNTLTCVFRNVDLERTMAEVQPIDLRILRHDRREPRTVMADPTCRLDAGRLMCQRPVIASDYTLWVVPEGLAEQAGSLALETAVRAGLRGGSGFALTGGR